jgi:uncharacterized repeat protein (TIGR03803 family)
MKILLALFITPMLAGATATAGETVRHRFSGGGEGGIPEAGLVMDKKGNLYGTTTFGGAAGCGVAFKINSRGRETVLHSFTGYPEDGCGPAADLLVDSAGNIYGTTETSGQNGRGTIFELVAGGTYRTRYSFSGPDGDMPMTSLVVDRQGNLYGTTFQGGESNLGTVFKLSPEDIETVLHSFSGGSDGANPNGLLAIKGKLYGTTQIGGTANIGTFFSIATTGKEKVLHTFLGGDDGQYPVGNLIADESGNLYGATVAGGSVGAGTVFEMTQSGVETILDDFSQHHANSPLGTLARDAAGDLFGTTQLGSADGGGAGTVFKLSPNATETILYSFKNGKDGGLPNGGIVQDAEGNIYGTTYAGGKTGCFTGSCGVAFEITP